MNTIRDTAHTFKAAPLFVLALVLTLVAAGFNGVMVFLMLLEVDLPGAFGQMTHFQEPAHRIHDLTFAFLFLPTIVGILLQFRRPSGNVAGEVMALIPSVGLVVTLILTTLFAGNARVLQPPWVIVGVAALITLSLHPAGRDFFRSFRVARVNRAMLTMGIAAAVPLLVLAFTNIGLQETGTDEHAAAGHYGFMAAFSLTVIGLGLLASLRPDGWRPTTWVAGLLPALFGVASLIYSGSSSLETPWAIAAVAWGIGFVVVGELAQTGVASGP